MKTTNALYNGFQQLGFDKELKDCLFLCEDLNEINDLNIKFHLEIAKEFNATAVFFRKELNNYKPQIYIYDYTGNIFEENNLTNIHKKVWSSGNVPLVCAFYDTEIKILDCTTPIKDKKPVYLATLINNLSSTYKMYNEQFAVKIKTGAFWEDEDNKNRFKFSNSAYDILIKWIKELRNEYNPNLGSEERAIINKVIVQSILIKYLEERQDEKGKKLFHTKYFNQFEKAKEFTDVLQNTNSFIKLLEELHKDFNGNLFEWNESEKLILKSINLTLLGNALKGYSNPDNKNQLVFEFIKYYEFSYVPVELISRLYEEFLGENKSKKGLYYTPAHLAKLLIDEAMPLKNYNKIDLNNYKLLDPSCGSGIFLVLGFKRLVQWWRLKQPDFNTKPKVKDLHNLLKKVYGVDFEEQATKLAAFSLCLALCDELSPMQILSELRFDDLTDSNIIYSDFFIEELNSPENKDERQVFEIQKNNFKKIKNEKFDLIIGNPPFFRGGNLLNINKNFWKCRLEDSTVIIPSKQIALKFLTTSFDYLKEDALMCLIQKSANLLYNPTSHNFKKKLFDTKNIVQIFDFTPLYEKHLLWDNGARVATCAIFAQNSEIQKLTNILHILLRPTKQTKDRLVFEIDDYDLHFVSRNEAINNKYIWKINLLGGGRLKLLINRLTEFSNLKNFLNLTDGLIVGEGIGGGKTLPNLAFTKNKILPEFLNDDYHTSYNNYKNKEIFNVPNLLIKEDTALPITLNYEQIKFSNEIVSFYSKNLDVLVSIQNLISDNKNLLKCFLVATSGKAFINKDTVITKEDIMNIPFPKENEFLLSDFEKNIVADVVNFNINYLSKRLNSIAIKPIIGDDKINSILLNYGAEFNKILNPIYQNNCKKYRLSDVVRLFDDTFIAVVFKYDDKDLQTNFHKDNSKTDIYELSNHNVSTHLNATRIIKIYDKEDTIIFIKPNQYKYWLSLIAYRDADKSFATLSKGGY